MLLILALLVGTASAFRMPLGALYKLHPHVDGAYPRTHALRMQEFEPAQFEPQGDPVQFAILALAVAVPFGYWWYITVPEARLALSKDKRLGDTGAYIDELARSDEARPVERWFFSKWLNQAPKKRTARTEAASMLSTAPTMAGVAMVEPPHPETAAESAAAPEQPSAVQKREASLEQLFRPASLKSNATPKFFSGDNPIVVTTGALLAAGIFATVAKENGQLAADLLVVCIGLIFGATRLTLK